MIREIEFEEIPFKAFRPTVSQVHDSHITSRVSREMYVATGMMMSPNWHAFDCAYGKVMFSFWSLRKMIHSKMTHQLYSSSGLLAAECAEVRRRRTQPSRLSLEVPNRVVSRGSKDSFPFDNVNMTLSLYSVCATTGIPSRILYLLGRRGTA